MHTLVQRSIPILLLVAGTASTIYGSRFHAQVVLEEREEEVEVLIPLAGAGGMGLQMPGAEQGPGGLQDFIKEKRIHKVLEEKIVPEWALCREVSIGGVKLLESGELQQTYSGRPPSLCPT
jgi:hypothetical protein